MDVVKVTTLSDLINFMEKNNVTIQFSVNQDNLELDIVMSRGLLISSYSIPMHLSWCSIFPLDEKLTEILYALLYNIENKEKKIVNV